MIREANKKDLDEILQLYLYLHEKSIPEDNKHLQNTWNNIINDTNQMMIYNRIGKKPVLAIEVDGYEYHKENTVQASRDFLKNHIMELYEIPLLRFKTNSSGEREKIIEMLDKLVG